MADDRNLTEDEALMREWLGDGSDLPDEPWEIARAAAPVLTQKTLQRYAELCRLDAERARLREAIVGALRTGLRVERGPLHAELRAVSEKRLSWDRLEDLVGREEAQRLKAEMEPSTVERLHVVPRRYYGAKRRGRR